MSSVWTEGMDVWAPDALAKWATDEAQADQYAPELERLISWFRVQRFTPRTVLEIGCLYGGTLDLWHALWPKAGKLGVDIRPERVLWDKGYTIIEGDSRNTGTFNAVQGLMPTVDLLHIDGDHDPDSFWADYNLYSVLVPPGGVILIHDTVGYIPDQWREVSSRYPDAFSIEEHPDGRCGFGVLPVNWSTACAVRGIPRNL